MEVGVKVFAETHSDGNRFHSNTAYLTFVGVDKDGKPVKTFEIEPETDEEKRRYEEALDRRQRRLQTRKTAH